MVRQWWRVQGTYGDIYNFPQAQFNSALGAVSSEKEDPDQELEEEFEDEEDVGTSEFVAVRGVLPLCD